jgi:hypothetical protein
MGPRCRGPALGPDKSETSRPGSGSGSEWTHRSLFEDSFFLNFMLFLWSIIKYSSASPSILPLLDFQAFCKRQ